MDGKYRKHPHYPIKYGIFKATDRSDTFWQGYIFDRELKVAPKRWNTKETHERDAWKRVSEIVDSIYGSGHTIATAIRETRQETIKTVLTRYIDEYYVDKQSLSGKPDHRKKKLIGGRRRGCNRIFEIIGDMSPNALDRDSIDNYIKQRLLRAAAATVKIEVELLKTALVRVLRERGAAIVHKMRGHIRLKPSPERETTIPLDKFEALVSELPDWMKLPARLQHFTGCRPSEIRELLWRNVFIDENCLKFEPWQVKEGKPRTVYLSEYFTAALAANFSKAPKNQYNQPISEYVFRGPKSKRIREDTYHAAWQRACERLGFIDPAKRKKSGRPVALFKKHDLRRTRISALMANGTNIKLIQNQVGHSGAAMTLKYTQPEKEAQLEMAQQIEDIDRSQFEKSKKRIEEIEAKKKRLLDVLQGKDVWTTEDVVKLVEEI